jgi:molybdopterin molybdotransferase
MNRTSAPTSQPQSLTACEPKPPHRPHALKIDPCHREQEDSVELATAIDRLRATLQKKPSVPMPLINALNQVLAAPLIAPNPFPPFDRAMMDGYAADYRTLTAQAPLDITGESAAGSANLTLLAQGTVVAIATGAPMPQGADCVIRKEYARVEGREIFVAAQLLSPGADCEPQGSIAMTGDILIPANTRLQPTHLAIAARHGLRELAVIRAYDIQILLIGNELILAGTPPQRGQIYEHNQILIKSFLAQHHINVLPDSPIIPDDKTAIRTAVQAALHAISPPDLILLVGGTSVGAHDYTRSALAPLGTWLFRGLNTRPGRSACALKTQQGIPVIALPGSPKAVSALMLKLITPVLKG